MGKLIDITGNNYGYLTVICRSDNIKRRTMWECQCMCGNTTIVEGNKLKTGHTKSCGCFRDNFSITHGMTNTPTYSSWENMIQRTTNPRSSYYKDYGGRGVTVCKRWLKFENFYKDMGERPKNKTLDRIDNNKGYSKKNCKWSTKSEQQWNRGITSRNKSGVVGVQKYGRKFIARIMCKGVNYKLGSFDNFDDAVMARQKAEIKHFGRKL